MVTRARTLSHGHGTHLAGERAREEVELEVRVLDPCAGADEPAGLEVRRGAHPAVEQKPLDAPHRHVVRERGIVERDWPLALPLHVGVQMVLQILAHPGEVVGWRDAGRRELVCVADAREHEQLR